MASEEPVMIKPYLAPGERFAAALDHVEEGLGLRGWALDVPHPGQPVALEARCAGQVVARGEAMMDRPDLDGPAGRVTHCGFLMGWSRFDVAALRGLALADSQARVTVHEVSTGAEVPSVIGDLLATRVVELIQRAPRGDQTAGQRELNAYLDILASGLFDAAWYRARYGAEIPATTPPLLHYIRTGEGAGWRPNLLFDPAAYGRNAGTAGRGGALMHFIRMAKVTGAEPSPHFDPDWYRRQSGGLRGAEALAHYLANRNQAAPNAWFDRARYAAASGEPPESDLYAHFVLVGAGAGLLQEAARGRIPDGVLDDIEQLSGRGVALPREPASAPRVPAMPPPPSVPEPAPPAALPSLVEMGAGALHAWARRLPERFQAAALSLADEAQAEPGLSGLGAQIVAFALRAGRSAPDRVLEGASALLARRGELAPGQERELLGLVATEAHRLFGGGARAEAGDLYRQLRAAGLAEEIILLRLMEVALDAGQLAEADALAAEIRERHGEALGPWAVIALSRLAELRGERAEAERLMRSLPSYPDIPAEVEAAAVHRLLSLGAPEAARERLEEAPDLPRPQAAGPIMRLAARLANMERLRELLAPGWVAHVPDWVLAEVMFLISNDARVASREGQRIQRLIYKAMEARGLASNPIVQARLHFLLMSRQWDAAASLFAELDGTPFAGMRETLLRKLEYLASSGQPEAAEVLYREHFEGRELNKWEGLAILRLFSDQKKWDEAGEVLLAHAGRGHDFGAAAHAAMRVVRRTNLHEAVLACEGRLGPTASAELKGFFGLVREDLTILESGRALASGLAAPPRGGLSRSNWLLQAPDAEPPSLENCLFLCSNQKYYLSLLTFLCSFIGQSPQVNARIFVFLDDDVPRSWISALRAVAAHFRQDITVVEEADFVPRDVEHRTEYGFFAGGSGLSRAAYFRLYAARYLLERHRFRRAVYVDTDIVCRGDLSGLFRLDMGDKPLCAATEEISPHVVAAATRNGIDPWRYFNSGVLLLRFDSPALSGLIEEAIRVSEQEPERLAFHDQCALNIAFKDAVKELPHRYNHFLRPSRDRNGHIEDGVLLHFLDRPKPWDIVFDRGYREEWRVWALFLGAILPQNLYVAIFAAANRE